MQSGDKTSVTFRYERLRALSAGVLETAATVFLLLVAVRWYQAGPIAKALVAGGGSLGLLLAPWLVSRVEAARMPVAKAASHLAVVSAVCYLAIAMINSLPVYVLGCVIALTASSASVPLLTQIYHENYPERERGQRFARTIMIRIAAAAVFSHLAGKLLSAHLDSFRWLLLIFALASLFAAYCLANCPSRPLHASGGTHPFRALRFFREDRLFRQTIIAWMFLGFAMLMISPLRVEYLANPAHGVRWQGEVLTAATVALLTGVIPNAARLALNPVWGWMFDNMNFFGLRLMLNAGLIAGILSFFVTGSPVGLIIGAVLFGISSAGADVAWSLWVTKFAPPERVADYMSVHTFFTGVRGVVAPVAAFYLASHVPLRYVGWLGAGLIVVGSIFLIPELRHGRGAPRGTALVEEAPE
jgi:MFS family permease